jgi:hypothetical protein
MPPPPAVAIAPARGEARSPVARAQALPKLRGRRGRGTDPPLSAPMHRPGDAAGPQTEPGLQPRVRPPELEHQAGDGGRPEDREPRVGLVEIGRAEREQVDPRSLLRLGITLQIAAHRGMDPTPVGKPEIGQGRPDVHDKCSVAGIPSFIINTADRYSRLCFVIPAKERVKIF